MKKKELSELSRSVYDLIKGNKDKAKSAIRKYACKVVNSQFNYHYTLINEAEVKKLAERAMESIINQPISAVEKAIDAGVEIDAFIMESFLRKKISIAIVDGIKNRDRRVENRVFGDNESDPWCIHNNVMATYYKYGGMNNKLLAHNHITPTDIKAWVEMRVRESDEILDFFGYAQAIILRYIVTNGSPERHKKALSQQLLTDSFDDERDGKPMFNELCAAVKYSPLLPDEKSAQQVDLEFHRFLEMLNPRTRAVLMDAAYGIYDDDKALAKALSTSIGNVYTLRKRAKTMFRKYLDNLE